MRLMLVTQDWAPSQALGLLKSAMEDRGHDVCAYLGKGQPLQIQSSVMAGAVEEADVLLLGMSSSVELAQNEIGAAQVAQDAGVTFGFYADTYNCYARPWFSQFRSTCSFLWVINEEEAQVARGLLSPERVVVVGNPIWERFFFPTLTRGRVRSLLGLGQERFVILCPGGKNAVVNLLHFGAAIEAAAALRAVPVGPVKADDPPVVLLSLHPGDQTEVTLYQQLVDLSDGLARIVPRETLSASSLLPGVDVILESASTLGIEAAHLRIPVVDFFSTPALVRLRSFGIEKWEPCQLGVAEEVHTIEHLTAVMQRIRNQTDSRWSRRQAEVYPAVAEPGATIKRMVCALENLLGP